MIIASLRRNCSNAWATTFSVKWSPVQACGSPMTPSADTRADSMTRRMTASVRPPDACGGGSSGRRSTHPVLDRTRRSDFRKLVEAPLELGPLDGVGGEVDRAPVGDSGSAHVPGAPEQLGV